MIKKMIMLVIAFMLVACGYTSHDNELTGQVKRVIKQTPLLCSNYVYADISLGVIRNGVGSMSSQDMDLTVSNEKDRAALQAASDSGKLVKIKYDRRRVTFCEPEEVITSVIEIQ
jgi:major membrane immunogen (membrane-anchored lipoprotein)